MRSAIPASPDEQCRLFVHRGKMVQVRNEYEVAWVDM